MFSRAHSLLLLLILPLTAGAQNPVAPCTDWLATVDEATQRIVLSWRPSADSATMGYHICTGTPCLDYDTVFGRMDTTYVCADHSSLEAHTYRLHVFDSSYNVSSLTEPFGNMVLQAIVPECDPTVTVTWTPYIGMPGGLAGYRLMMRLEPYDDDFIQYHSTLADGPTSYSFEMPSGVVRAHIKVLARNSIGTLVSQSNIISVERQTIDTAAFVEISQIDYDTLSATVRLQFNIDTSYHGADHYTLWRSVDFSPWRVIATGNWQQYIDSDINLYDSLYCYQLSVFDACELNEKFSSTACVVVPDPPEPNVAIPNVLVVGSPDNGAFLPYVVGLAGDIYELYIYNRHGLLLFSTTDPTEPWRPDASTPQGAYAYVLRVKYVNGIVQTYTGTLLVIK